MIARRHFVSLLILYDYNKTTPLRQVNVYPEPKKEPALMPRAWLIILLNALYSIADALCSVFVGVYFYIHSFDVSLVFQHYATLYLTTPIAFIVAGWYAKTKDRAHVFRIGLILHAVYYASLLYLREESIAHVIPLGALFGITWGFFWAGNNTFQYDFSPGAKGREYFLGLISGVSNGAKLIAPLLSGAIISLCPTPERGYHTIFFLALLIYLVAIAASFKIPHHRSAQPFRLQTALLPPKEHRDWRLILLASFTLAGSFHIFHFLMAIMMYMESGSEAAVGGYVSLQGIVTVLTAFWVGKFVQPRTRASYMFWGVAVLVAAGMIVTWDITYLTLILFAFLRSISLPLFGIPHTAIRFEVMQQTLADASERIEYLCAWEVPLACGRLSMMCLTMLIHAFFGVPGLRFTVLFLCLVRIATYMLVTRVSFVKDPALAQTGASRFQAEIDHDDS